MPVRHWVRFFGQGRLRARLDPDFVLKGAGLRPSREEILAEMGKGGSYWGTSPRPS